MIVIEQRTEQIGNATVFHGMPFVEYCKLPGLNASCLKGNGKHSPKHLDCWLRGLMKKKDSVDMKFGRAGHCIVLEPDRFDADFPIATQCVAVITSKGENQGKRCGNQGCVRNPVGSWFCGVHGKTLPEIYDYVTEDEHRRLLRMREALKTSSANAYLARPGFHECVITWTQFGLDMKCRIDKMSVTPELITIIDLKKAQVGKAEKVAAQKSCLDMGYDVQAWWQIAGAQAAYGADMPIDMNFLFIEDDEPFDTCLLPVDMDQDIPIADRYVVGKLTDYVRCKKTGVFHGCQRVIDPATRGILPAWHVKKMRQGE